MWLAVLASILYFTYFRPDVNARVVIVSAFHAPFDLAIAGRVLVSRPPERPCYNYMFVVVGAMLGGLGHIVRGSIYLVAPPAQASLLEPGTMQITFLALGIMVLPTLSIGLVTMTHDRLAQRLERLTRFDELTGALSRKAFVAVMDIDHFKSVNDRHGHAAGDEVLRHFANIVAARIGPNDVFGRIGGEEFCLFCGPEDIAQVRALVERLRATVETTSCGGLHYIFSAGIGAWDGQESLALLMARANGLFYAAKVAGRNRVMSPEEDALA